MSNATAIDRVMAWEALDSRGTPTVACEVRVAGGAVGTATVPSGASTGAHEARELRDGGERYAGRGVQQAVSNVERILGPAVHGHDARDQAGLDATMRQLDGTPNLGRLGANAILAVSIATARAAAAAANVPLHRYLAADGDPLLPMPMINIVSGGAHAGGAVDVQDFLIVPVGAESFAQAIEWAWRVRRATASVASERGLIAVLVADEGGLGPSLPSNRAALELLASGIARAGLQPGAEVAIAIDVAATQFVQGNHYHLAAEDRTVDAAGLLEELAEWRASYPIVSLEDPVGEDDWDGWRDASTRWATDLQLLGDDLFATDLQRLERGIDMGVANAVLVKPNQSGTLSGAKAVVIRAHEAGYATVVSARSGDTEDDWLADLAVGWRAGQIKVGSLTRSERTAKWNRLLRIEKEAGGRAVFAGRAALGRRRT
ncbi:MAG: eno [Chloroflexi bacterium]|nr:eno [Chloroflexota bacterium]